MKFNDTTFGRFLFGLFDINGFDYELEPSSEYDYEQLEDGNLHTANFLFLLISKGKEKQAKELFELGLFRPEREKYAELELFLSNTIEYSLRNNPIYEVESNVVKTNSSNK